MGRLKIAVSSSARSGGSARLPPPFAGGSVVTEAGPDAFVADLLPAVQEAAARARALEGHVANHPKAGEASDVKAALTEADTAVQEALLGALLPRFADVELEAEEDTPSVRRFSGARAARVVLDPIDGTLRSYLAGEGPYAVMIGLDLEDRFVGSLVGLPREGHLFYATAGGGAFHVTGESGPVAARLEDDGKDVLVSYALPAPVEAALRERGYRPRGACGGAIAVAPLLPGVVGGLRIPTPPPVSPRGRIGLLVAREAGARVGLAEGPAPSRLSEPMPHVAVAATDAVLADLQAALAAA